MYERGKRESGLVGGLRGWTVVPLEYAPAGVTPTFAEVGEFRLPSRFGGWWRHHEDGDGGEQAPSGREVVLWLRVVDGRVDIEEVTLRGFSDEFERQGVPAMRDMLTMMFSVFDGTVPMSPAGALNAAPVEVRERALREHGRRRRRNARNAIDHERVAELYRAGGAARVADEECVSMATAFRWVRAARDAGVLEGGK